MNLLGSLGSKADSTGSTKKPQPSTTELFSNAKLVAEAAQATLSNEKEKIDQGKVAGAASDLLAAGSHYGKLDEEKGMGAYVKKAETYLDKYESSHSIKTAKPAPDSTTAVAENAPSAPSGGEDEKKENDFGGYLKTAQGFLK
ncbi:nodulin-related protein 2-like [Aristolochia californica]|uniref:nodulin-related protein 2-like n=1 Tax=Aristolochia californica TaxID=171875 RepID=UPI0035DDD9B6